MAGASPNSVAAAANLAALLPEGAELELVDVLLQPGRALADAVLVTPMLEKRSPRPGCRIFGDLSDRALVLRTLGLTAVPS